MTAHYRRISFLLALLFCQPTISSSQDHPSIHEEQLEEHDTWEMIVEPVNVTTGLENLILNFPEKINGMVVGIVTNHTGLDSRGRPNWIAIEEETSAQVDAIFTPEHGLSGEFLAGEDVAYHSEENIHLPKVFSLYGAAKKPTAEMLSGLDILIYDIQDVGARFYTYITTLGLIMEASAESDVPVLIIDRPNPITGAKVSGPTLDMANQSFIGYYPIPVQYGLTPGELALMIAGEEWINDIPELEVIPMINWSRELWYDETNIPWVSTSPNIPDVASATVYPGTCFLEATNVSEGRGTPLSFLQAGAPWIDDKLLARKLNQLNLDGVLFRPVSFTPKHPENTGHKKYHEEKCYGVKIVISDRRIFDPVVSGIHLLNQINELYSDKMVIKVENLNRLSGTDELSKMIKGDITLQEILEIIRSDISLFMEMRKPYLLY